MNESMESRADEQTSSPETSLQEGRQTSWDSDSVEFSSEATRMIQQQTRKRRVRLPIILFIATCLSCFFAGMTHWEPGEAAINLMAWSNPQSLGIPREYDLYLSNPAAELRRDLLNYASAWRIGFIYMAAMLGILFAHEMGHFLMAVRYRVHASLPYFIPVPISPIGTFGAVIGMDGMRANRKQLFDIGLAGPLAGLVVAVPILWYGITQMDLTTPGEGSFKLDLPLAMQWMMQWLQVPGYKSGLYIYQSQLNPYFMAGWVGLLVTGLNMIPVSQLDGGHVTYTLFGKKAHLIARAFLAFAVIFIITMGAYNWLLMLFLVILMRPDHPPTSDDSVPIGAFRYVLGTLSLSIPILCFPPMAFVTT